MRVIVAHKPQDIPKKPVDGKPTLIYWNILGLSQTQRLALVAAGVDDFVDVRIEAGPGGSPDYGKNWLAAKKELDETGVLTFPNLPYYLDEHVSITQSDTITQYIARQYGNHDKDAPLVHVTDTILQTYQDMIMDTLSDSESHIARMSYTPDQGPDAVKGWYLSGSVLPVLKKFESLNDTFWTKAANDKQVTIAHLKMYVYLHKLTVIQKEFGNDETAAAYFNDWCKAFMKRIEGLPKIKEYMESDNYMKTPLNNGSAKWRGM
jgi:Glutathione S-transferase, C-terminal domain/Glutathione S-transferase, N-terminal domain